ncbi:MAG: dUTP diphosphatase [Clostridia bacterium]|nr:dUTP diphosphatase [Clostridia bacterium]
MEFLKIKKVRENAKLPTRGTVGSAGLDLYACIDEPITLNGGDKAVIPTGIAIGLDNPKYAAFVYARSGLAIKHGIGLLNSVGVIDSDYRGEICVGVINQLKEPYTIQPSERIAQMVIQPVALPELVEVDELDDTDRGAGGFGSTGRK